VPVDEYSKPEKEVTTEIPTKGSKVKIILDGSETEFVLDDKRTILQAAQDAGIDPPFSCESGICSTCMAKVLEGAVVMDENNILTDDEVRKGYVLTCQAHPTTPVVVIEYFD
jgi:ring-1,2-phenylacetyl-CoA epoxidase subunit PaaE